MKKGFTLVELIAVIIIVALLALLTIPIARDILDNNKRELCKVQMDSIMSAARNFGSKNYTLLPPNDGDILTITLGDLIESGYINDNIKNPFNNQNFPNYMEIVIKREGKKYTYSFSSDYTEEVMCNSSNQ